MIISAINQKGGVGKTTTCVSLAAMLARRKPTLLIDADPQGSSAAWADRGEMPFDISQVTEYAELMRLRSIGGYDFIMVDSPPVRRAEGFDVILNASDFVIVPMRPSTLDLISTRETVTLLRDIPYRVLFTMVDTRSMNEAVELARALGQAGIPIFKTYIRLYKAHERASLEGVSIVDYRGENAGKAAADYKALANELIRYLKGV